ncbi:type I-B CRISPR-associated protein Cas7/Cst2/DevR [Enterococcus sp. 669A]|uniref:Type I-B CRISPR-associated protein Cas7/Cst2/DevR n=1 Tax=Candidatus Enterococcus moelleringii TaxID=2815325 RepID=A0ABS3L576_9ENTE|nr:type I-B CRISPR-associated protein Cas7/Cst2/DevR [Enterococcus sp. 669A]MBO1304768.1 type I-B CRISPR-associated protein Cas7/Cst2/DevR [Enterococcus sp. 669A]
MQKISCITLTVLTESPIALSNDQGFGNYTPIKKFYFKDGIHAMTSVATFTYELRKCLFENFGWKLNDLTIKSSNSYFNNVEDLTEKNLEADVFGFLLPNDGVSKTSPLRVIPFVSATTYRGDTQLITNRGFLNLDLERNRFNEKGEEIPDEAVPSTQALANEEVFGDYYAYTVTIELDRIGMSEVAKGGDGKYHYVSPSERNYMPDELRIQAVQDILNALTILTRDIKHQRVLLKPLAVFGGAFDKVIPYFWDAVCLNEVQGETGLKLDLSVIEEVEAAYQLQGTIKAADKNLLVDKEAISTMPVQAIQQLAERLTIKNNDWYLKD